MSKLTRQISRAVVLNAMRPLPALPTGTRIELAGKRVLLTGASSGIGAEAAKQFAAAGATVLMVARRADLLNDLVAEIAAAGGSAQALPCDLTDMEAIDALADAAGPVDILINNAGRSIRRPLGQSLERWHDLERTMDLNYFAPLRLIRAVAPGMRERRDGHIINVSTWGVMQESPPLFAAYTASKAALTAVSRAIETEWSHHGVHSTTLFYPLVATPMISPTRAYDGLPALSAREAAGWMVDAARTRPVRIAPKIAMAARALDAAAPSLLNMVLKRQAGSR